MEHRIEKWDLLKLFLIFCVVLGHFLDEYCLSTRMTRSVFFYIYLFHMPLFLFVSGLFSKKNIQQKRYDRIFGYLLMYFALKVLLFLVKMLIWGRASFSFFSENGIPWFLFALFAFQMITILMSRLKPLAVFILAIIIGCIAGYDNALGDFLVLSRLLVFYPFFFAGYCLNEERVRAFTDRKSVRIVSILLLALTAVLVCVWIDKIYWIRPLLTGRNTYQSLNDLERFGGLFRAFYYLIVFCIGGMVVAVIPNRLGKGRLARMGQHTIGVYTFHYPVIWFLYAICGLDQRLSVALQHGELLLIPIAAAVTCIFSAEIFEKAVRKIMKLCEVRDKEA